MKWNNKKSFPASFQYDKEIKDKVETEGRELSDLPINLVRKYYEDNFLKSRDTSLGIFEKFISHKDESIETVHGSPSYIRYVEYLCENS